MEKLYTAALLHFLPFGPRSNARLFAHFGSAEAIWKASNDQLRLSGIEEKPLSAFTAWRQTHKPQELFEKITKLNLEVITRTDERYPKALNTIYDPPLGFFLMGNLPDPFTPLVSIVGSRDCTGYGIKIAQSLASDLAAQGIGVVSGGARGIDEYAHLAAAKTGYTLAVLAQGHTDLASRHRNLVQVILKNGGGIISEYPPSTEGLSFRYPIRNRLIAGLSRGTVVIEAKIASGSLITAQAAIEAGREVFAVPGPIDSPSSEGTNRLIKDGAHVVTCAADINEALNLHLPQPLSHKNTPTAVPVGDTPIEQTIIQHLTQGPLHIDQLARASSHSLAELLTALTYLEMAGKVRGLGNMEYGL